jgi:hypothetical protein
MTRSTTGTRTTRAKGWAQALSAPIFFRYLILALWLGLTAPAQAADVPGAVDALAPPSRPLGQHMRLLTETDTPWTWRPPDRPSPRHKTRPSTRRSSAWASGIARCGRIWWLTTPLTSL